MLMIKSMCAMVVVLLGASPVLAGTISYSHSESVLPVSSLGSYLAPQYSDPGGQPLTKVTLTVVADSTGGSNTFDNEDPAGGAATVTIGSEIKVSGPLPGIGSQLIVRADPQNSNSGLVTGDTEAGPPDFIGTDSISVSGTFALDSNLASKTLASDMAPYLGAGTVILDWITALNTAGSFTTTGGGANSVEFGTIRSNFTATLTYEFVPEPASWVLMVSAGLVAAIPAMLHWLRRRPTIV
jgi:hypothetical protein